MALRDTKGLIKATALRLFALVAFSRLMIVPTRKKRAWEVRPPISEKSIGRNSDV